MTSSPLPGPPHHQRVIDALCEAFARDEMALEEFERRVERVHRAASADELDGLLADLPSVRARVPEGEVGSSPDPERRPRAAPSGAVRARELVAAIMGGAARNGRWTPARQTTAVAVMGGVELDFREAVLAPGVTEIHAFAFCGGVEILAAPGVRLECNGLGVMGLFDHGEDPGDASEPDPDGPILRVTGVAIMGAVEVKVRNPGESGREARRRVRETRRGARLRDPDQG